MRSLTPRIRELDRYAAFKFHNLPVLCLFMWKGSITIATLIGGFRLNTSYTILGFQDIVPARFYRLIQLIIKFFFTDTATSWYFAR